MRTTALTAAAAGCALLLLSACSSSDEPDAGASASGSPIEAYLQPLQAKLDGVDRAALARKSEEAIASCMHDAGFDYTPGQVSEDDLEVEDEQGEPGTVEFATVHGYGIWGYTDGRGDDPEDEQVDPNAEYVASMTETESTAYYEAFMGPAPDPDAEGASDWSQMGCVGKAAHEAYGEDLAFLEDPALIELDDERTRIAERATTAADVVAVEAAWSECMNEEGYDFATVAEAKESISDAFEALYADAKAADPDGRPDQAALTQLGDRDKATAVADATCQESSGYREKLVKARNALEQEYVDSHKAELDALLSSAGVER